MAKARIVKLGEDQVVLFPKNFLVNSKLVEIFHRGDTIVLREIGASEKRKKSKATHKRAG